MRCLLADKRRVPTKYSNRQLKASPKALGYTLLNAAVS